MKNKKILMAGAAMVALSPMVANSVLADTEVIQARARVLQAVDISELANLDFGTFSVGATGGAILIAPTGADTLEPNTVNQVGISAPHEAKVNIKGTAGFPVVLAVTAPTITVTNGTTTMVVNNFNIGTDAGGTNYVQAMVAATETAQIGASLTVGNNQAAGIYLGNFTISANYQ
jgi:hypothetical protein